MPDQVPDNATVVVMPLKVVKRLEELIDELTQLTKSFRSAAQTIELVSKEKASA